MDFWRNSTPFFGATALCVTKIGNSIKLPQNENDPKVHHPLDDHSKDCHLPQNKNLSMRLHYDLCRTSFLMAE